MKKANLYFLITLIVMCLASCQTIVKHSDPFYNDDGGDDFPYTQFPLIKPYYVYTMDVGSPWIIELRAVYGALYVIAPENEGGVHYYYDIWGVETISVQDGIIMAYSPYVDDEAPQSIQDNYYHWFVIIPDEHIAMGFHDENAFQAYIQKLGIQNPDWQTPKDAISQFEDTGCLDWIPDCK